MTNTRRGGRERRGAGTQGRAGTALKVEGDVVMADADENSKRRAQGQRRGGKGGWSGRVRGRRRVRKELVGSGTRDVLWVRRAVWGRTRSLTGCSSAMGYCTGAEHKVVTNENSPRWCGAALCPSGEARLQERRTGRQIQHSDKLVPGSWLMVLRTRSRRDCWDRQVAALVYSRPKLRSHISVAPPWTDSWSVWAIHRLATWRQGSLHGKMVVH